MRSKQPSDADSQGELIPYGDPVDPQVQVLGRLLFHVGVGAAGVPFRASVVKMPPPPGWGGPQWLISRLVSGVGARLHTRSAPLGAVPGRFNVWSAAALVVLPVTRGGPVFSSRPQNGVIALEVCLTGHRGGFPRGPPCRPCMVALWLRVAVRGSRRLVRLGGAPAGLNEGVERVFLAAGSDGPPVARWGVSGVVALASGCAWVYGGPWVGASPDVVSPGVPVSLCRSGAVDGAVPAGSAVCAPWAGGGGKSAA